MDDEHTSANRVRFYGPGDLATYWQAERATELADQFDPHSPPTTVTDIIELHNALQYVQAGFFPPAYDEARRAHARERIPQITSAVATFFASVDDTNLAPLITDVDRQYHHDLLDLLGRGQAFQRCDAATMLPVLIAAGVRLAEMLACKKLVLAYDTEIRDAILAAPRNAEHLVRKHLQHDVQTEIHLPRSLTPADARTLLEAYLDSADANLNYVRLIETAPVTVETGVDAKLKLRAQRRKQQMSEEFFKDHQGIRYGARIEISDTQQDPVTTDREDMVVTLTYSDSWLRHTLDYPSILNNFQHLFEFADSHVLLTLPSYPANLGVFERFLTTAGKTDYRTGLGFRVTDLCSLMQTRVYRDYLASHEIDLEAVIAWFFEVYLPEEFDAANFSFTPSDDGSSYLSRTRHLFAEMDSTIKQFALFAENGDLDRELLTISSGPVPYKQIPSRVPDKYIYATEHTEITSVLNCLFSDQSSLTYISEELQADNAAELLVENTVAYSDFADHQRPAIDFLIDLGILQDTGARVRIANASQFRLLRALFSTQAASYFHLGQEGRTAVDAMVARGWMTRRSSLLTDAEASYINFLLNKVEFHNGPELRNKYMHGSQPHGDEDLHFQNYLYALRLMIDLVIKLNDDFILSASLEAAETR